LELFSSSSTTGARVRRACDHGRDARAHRRHSRHPGRGHGAARRPADRQADSRCSSRRSIPRCCRAANKVAALLAQRSDIRDLDDGQPLPGIDWRIEVDKSQAAKYGAGVNTVGSAIQLVTNGLKATEYRPVDSDKSVDILVRFPPERRSLDQIDDLRVQTQVGHVPIGNFVERVPAERVGYINRVNANRVTTVSANVAEACRPPMCSRKSPPIWPRPIWAGRHVPPQGPRTRSARRRAPS